MASKPKAAVCALIVLSPSPLGNLGWQASKTRKVLLARHMLRLIPSKYYDKETAIHKPKDYLLFFQMFILLATSQKYERKLSASYFPKDKPKIFFFNIARTFNLKTSGSRLLDISNEVGDPDIWSIDGVLSTDSFDSWQANIGTPYVSERDRLLEEEYILLTQGTNLTEKEIQRQRADHLLTEPLLGNRDRESFTYAVKSFFSHLNEDNNNAFDFWLRWYVDRIEGTNDTGPVCAKLAELSNSDWHQGPAHIAEKIREIEADLLAEKSQLAETLEYDPETDKIHVRHIPVQKPAHIDALLDNVEDALDVACLKGNTNPNEGVYASLRLMLEKRRNKPQSIEITCSRAATDLRRMMGTGELPEDSNQTGLLHAVEELGRGVRAHHPDVAEYRNRMVEQSLRELGEGDREQLTALQDLIEQVGDEDLIEETREDVAILTAEQGYVAPGAAARLRPVDAAARLAHRTLGLKQLAKDLCEKGGKVFDSPEVKTVRLLGLGVGVIGGAITVFISLFGIL